MGAHEHGVCSAILDVLLQCQARGGMSSDGLFRMGGGYHPRKNADNDSKYKRIEDAMSDGSCEPWNC
jgi:hypothetical protein